MGVGAEKHDSSGSSRNTDFYRGSDKLQCAIYYAIDGDQVCVKATYQIFVGCAVAMGDMSVFYRPHQRRPRPVYISLLG